MEKPTEHEEDCKKTLIRYKNILQSMPPQYRIPQMVIEDVEKISNGKMKHTTNPVKGGIARFKQRLDKLDTVITIDGQIELDKMRLPDQTTIGRKDSSMMVWNIISKLDKFLKDDKEKIEAEKNPDPTTATKPVTNGKRKRSPNYLTNLIKRLNAVKLQFTLYFEKMKPKEQQPEEEKKEVVKVDMETTAVQVERVAYDYKANNNNNNKKEEEENKQTLAPPQNNHRHHNNQKKNVIGINFEYKLYGVDSDGRKMVFDQKMFKTGHDAIIHGKRAYPLSGYSFWAEPKIIINWDN